MNNNVPPKIYETLKHVVKGNIDNYDVTIHDPNKKGEGFLGEMVYITLEDKKTEQKQDFVVKQAFSDQAVRDIFPIRNVFTNEIHFYANVWPTLNKFQQRILPEYQFQKVPKCFSTLSEEKSEQIIFENLKYQNFVIHNKKIPLDKKHFELILKEYGKFHALSFAYREMYPKEFEKLLDELQDVYTDLGENNMFHKAMIRGFEDVADSLEPDQDEEVIKVYKHITETCYELYCASLDCETKYTVITHGDCWSNNMMFKYNENKEVTDVRFFDFQLAKLGSPCCDLAYCIYSGAPKEILDDFDYYLGVYHESLSNTLRQFGCDPDELYPLEALRKDWKKYCKLGVAMSLMIWKIKMTYEGEFKDLHDGVEMKEDEQEDPPYDKAMFKKITRDLILHLYENDFL